jgi:hypothetical protein
MAQTFHFQMRRLFLKIETKTLDDPGRDQEDRVKSQRVSRLFLVLVEVPAQKIGRGGGRMAGDAWNYHTGLQTWAVFVASHFTRFYHTGHSQTNAQRMDSTLLFYLR